MVGHEKKLKKVQKKLLLNSTKGDSFEMKGKSGTVFSNLTSFKSSDALIKQAIRIGEKAKNPVYVSPGHKYPCKVHKILYWRVVNIKYPRQSIKQIWVDVILWDYDTKIMEQFEPRSEQHFWGIGEGERKSWEKEKSKTEK